jgi:Ion channel
MHTTAILGAILLVAVLLDAFETIVLPRRVRRHFRLTTWFYYLTWIPWARIARKIQKQVSRESFLGYFGPLSLIFLLVLWAGSLILGFALLQDGAGEHVQLGSEHVDFGTILYQSGETFFTLGYGDVLPTNGLARALSVAEAGMGFGFLGVVIGYLPTIYSAFSQREIEISLLDARAGSPPTAAELLMRYGVHPDQVVLDQIFRDWERWGAEVLESHLSYPVLSFFRSQHNNQSWLGALTTILDATSLVIAGIDGVRTEQARLTFAMARHAVVDLAQVVNARYDPNVPDRLPPEELERLRKGLAERGLRLTSGPEMEQKLSQLRLRYEPYAQGIAKNMLISLPPWMHPEKKKDNWQAGPWDRIIQAKGLGQIGRRIPGLDDHF